MRPSMLGNKPDGHGPASIKEVKKLTFNQWWDRNKLNLFGQSIETAKAIWRAAQENKE